MALHTGLIFVVGSVHCLRADLKVNTQNDVIMIGRDRMSQLGFYVWFSCLQMCTSFKHYMNYLLKAM